MTHRITIAALCAIALSQTMPAAIRGEWRLHQSFFTRPTGVIPTPNKTYFISLGQHFDPALSDYASRDAYLFTYDKEADEVQCFNKGNYLSENILSSAQYNPWQRYLLITYTNGNIDLLFDDNSVLNVPALMNATLNTSKAVNCIRFDHEKNRAYLATDFGYMVLDGSKGAVIDSRVYNRKITSAARVGSKFIISDSEALYWIDASDKAFSFSDFRKIDTDSSPSEVMPLTDNTFAFITPSGLWLATIDGDSISINKLGGDAYNGVQYNRDGFLISNRGSAAMINTDGVLTQVPRMPGSIWTTAIGSWDNQEFWLLNERDGLSSFRLNDGNWTATRTNLVPNSPSAYICRNMEYNSKYGMLVNNHECSYLFPTYVPHMPALPSGLKNGEWTNYGFTYTLPDNATIKNAGSPPNGITVDPDNPDLVYFGSFSNGMIRMNLADASQSLILSHTTDENKDFEGFRAIVPDLSWSSYCNFSRPAFDSAGNLWVTYDPFDNTNSRVYVWPAASRRSGDVSGLKSFTLSNVPCGKDRIILPLKASVNRNLLIYSNGVFNTRLVVIDTNGTPTDFTDDKKVIITSRIDGDGNKLGDNYTYTMYEDPSTGTVWVGGANGLFTLNPSRSFQEPDRVNRIKVSRDDGTNLADYLLDNIPVYFITADPQGRKWFATGGAGIVITSADGRKVEQEINTSNSMIPSNNVYSLAYNPENNSMMVSTQHGLAELMLSADGSSSSTEETKASIYPNPVRPDYLGWVTIENLPDNAIVKITDAAGNLVKELGFAESGMVRWDVTNTEMKRVRSGVYYVFASAGPDAGEQSVSGKILVIN